MKDGAAFPDKRLSKRELVAVMFAQASLQGRRLADVAPIEIIYSIALADRLLAELARTNPERERPKPTAMPSMGEPK